MLTVPAAPFSHAWSLTDSRRLQAAYALRNAAEPWAEGMPPQEENALTRIDNKLALAIAGHVVYVAQSQGLSEPPHAQDVQVTWLHAWRAAAAGRPLDQEAGFLLGQAWLEAVASLPSLQGTLPLDDATAQEVHRELVATIEQGRLAPQQAPAMTCASSGQGLRLRLEGWTPTFMRFNRAQRRYEPLPAGTVQAAELEHLTLEVPSGQLLVADWFRLDAFTTQAKQAVGLLALSSVAACAERTRRLAAAVGALSVYAGDTGPSVHAHAGGIQVGTPREPSAAHPSPQGPPLGQVVCDLHWVTAIDRQVLEDVLARLVPRDVAAAQVAAYLDHHDSVVRVEVPPGTYHVYFAGNPRVFAQRFAMNEVDMAGFSQPVFVLHPHALTPRQEPSVRRALRSP